MVLVFEQVWKIGATAEVCVLLCQRHRLRLPCTCCLLAVPAGCACCLLSVCWLLAAVPAGCWLTAGCWLPCLLAAGCWLPCLLPLPAGSASASWPPCRPNKACLPIVVHQLVAALLSPPFGSTPLRSSHLTHTSDPPSLPSHMHAQVLERAQQPRRRIQLQALPRVRGAG